MIQYNLSQELFMAQIRQEMVLREFAAMALGAQLQKESRMIRRFRLLFRVRRLMHRLAPRIARTIL